MKKKQGFTIIEMIITVFFFFFFVTWPINFYKFTKCDFKGDYKCEITHGIGVVVFIASPITLWTGTDEKKEDK
jgi:hypothetical protein